MITVPPIFTLFPKDQEVTANGRIELECGAEGTPTPKITWRVNNTNYPCMSHLAINMFNHRNIT